MITHNHFVQPKLLTTKQAAQILNVHENTVRRWSKRGIIKSYRIGSRSDRRFAEADINTLNARIHQQAGDVRDLQVIA
jgi:excisionase family DNA binding protein